MWSNDTYNTVWGNKKPLTKALTQLTDHKDGERVIYWCVTVGGVKAVNSTLWRFQSYEPQLTDEPKHRNNIIRTNAFVEF